MTRDSRSSLLLALFTAAIVFLFTLVSDLILEHTRPVSFWPYLIDDLLMSLFSGTLVWAYERRRLREIARKLYVISEMNHRVRNELQVIQYSAYTSKEKEHMAMIRESVSKIETALNEILEGRKKPLPRTRTAGGDQ